MAVEKIKIILKNLTLAGELFDTRTARAVAEALPVESVPEEWGDEFYFEIPVEMPLDETATAKVKVGDIGYWPPGNALAIFFGPTPISSGSEPVAASDVNIIGRVTGDVASLNNVKGAGKIRIEKA